MFKQDDGDEEEERNSAADPRPPGVGRLGDVPYNWKDRLFCRLRVRFRL
jgi:hypothetical protein